MGRPKGSRNKGPGSSVAERGGVQSGASDGAGSTPAPATIPITIGSGLAVLQTGGHLQASPGDVDDFAPTEPALDIPPDWTLGALLNVRNTGADYVVTLYPEEYDWRHPERALRFANSFLVQAFVSAWYSRIYHDPRAR